MANVLTVTATHDYSAEILAGIRSILFSSGDAAVIATFAAKQFGGQISNAVHITGDIRADAVTVRLDKQHVKFSAGAWELQSWSTSDVVHIVGSSKVDKITGATVGSGFVTIQGGPGADILHGGNASNLFDYVAGDLRAGEKIFGGTLTDTIRLFGAPAPAHYDFTHVKIASVESLSLTGATGSSSVATFTGKQLAAFHISAITESNTVDDTVIVKGSFVNLSPVFFNGWENGVDILRIQGTKSNDSLIGSTQNDELIGGRGQDKMSGGGGNDKFVFKSASESLPGAHHRDVINDFQHGDLIDLSAIDANGKQAGDLAFNFITTDPLQHAGDLHYVDKGGYLLVEGDTTGDGKADFQIEVHGVASLTGVDFIP